MIVQKIHTFENAAISPQREVLNDIHLKSKNIAIFQRNMAHLRQKLLQIANQGIDCRANGTQEDILYTLKNYLDNRQIECLDVLSDIRQLVMLFQEVTQASTFRFLFATITTDMCSRFHTDINNLRLLCTYLGPGTLWLPNQAINYTAVKSRGSNEEMVTDQQLIQQLSPGDVCILKGALYPDANPVLHKSPPIEKNGEKRLLLRIDTNESSKLWS